MLDTAARVALSPLLIGQALSVRRRAQSLPEAAGPRTGKTGTGPTLRLRIIGDSSAAGVGASRQDQALVGQLVQALSPHHEVVWHLDALIGATTRSTLDRLAQVSPMPADVVVTALGVNDVTRLVPARQWLSQQKRLLARIRELYQPRHIYLSGMAQLEHFPLLPNPLRWTLARQGRAFQRTMTAYAATVADISYLPFKIIPRADLMASDGFHPAPPLYTIWGQTIANQIMADATLSDDEVATRPPLAITG